MAITAEPGPGEPAASTAMATPGCAVVLAADDPERLARFYAAMLGSEPQAGLSRRHWRVPWPAGGHLEIYAPSRQRPLARQAGRLAIALRRTVDPDDAGGGGAVALQQWIAGATAFGAVLDQPPRQEAFGAEAWLLDPEGNRLLLLLENRSPPCNQAGKTATRRA